MIVLKMVLKEKSSEVGKSTSELANHTSKSNFLAQIDLKIINADVEKTTKIVDHKLTIYLSRKKNQKIIGHGIVEKSGAQRHRVWCRFCNSISDFCM